MSYLYFDESIRDSDQFIIGALISSNEDLTDRIRQQWTNMGLDPNADEYKSSAPRSRQTTCGPQKLLIPSRTPGILSEDGLIPHKN